jgi:hypothetical protein
MRILKGLALAAALAGLSCSASGPVTPAEAYARLTDAAARGDAGAVAALLSRESLEHIDGVASLFRAMASAQRDALARHYGIAADRLANLGPSDYVALLLSREPEHNAFRQALESPLLDIERRGGAAAVRLQNGMSLLLVREGPYWKLDVRDY